MRPVALARVHGLFNLATGLWPLVHMKSFEAVLGPKTDRWLVRTVGGILAGVGYAQLRSRDSRDSLESARRIGVGTAATMTAIDLTYAPADRISSMYLADAAIEVGWLIAWATTRRRI